jgi:hypothetical protein
MGHGMSASETLTKAVAMNVRLWIHGEHIRMLARRRVRPQSTLRSASKCAIMNAMRAALQLQKGDYAGTLIDPDGGACLRWGPYLSADDVRRMRGKLCDLIEAISTREGWQREALDDVVAPATCGPLSDLLPSCIISPNGCKRGKRNRPHVKRWRVARGGWKGLMTNARDLANRKNRQADVCALFQLQSLNNPVAHFLRWARRKVR